MSKKFVAVLNKTGDISQLFNALGHITAGLAGSIGDSKLLSLIDYKDSEGNIYPNISEYPFIVLKGNSNKIREFRMALIQKDMPYSCFLNTMTHGGSDVQVENTRQKKSDDLEILAVVTFGEKSDIDLLTKKFSLWS
ncbi:DUF2000 domain-containing protein [Leptolyngbya sp. AN03gr2]|uniref:DUF2000 domain-containing protein n=1 Tax=unclassified Leptolyngbya TaxID=2650499 RepID=UPI003D31CB66